jgi:hypothetical protein
MKKRIIILNFNTTCRTSSIVPIAFFPFINYDLRLYNISGFSLSIVRNMKFLDLKVMYTILIFGAVQPNCT